MELTHRVTAVVDAPSEAVYALVSDVTRTGEWSPTCRACEWQDPSERGVGATFVGHNETPVRKWSTTSTVVAATPGREFGWEVGQGFVRWGYLLAPHGEGRTEVTHTWEFTEVGLRYFEQQYGEDAPAQVRQRTEAAHRDMPATLAAIRAIVEREHGARSEPA